jgi:phage virion morphogenesis protein
MSTSGFTVTLDDAQVQAALTRLTSRLANMTPIMEDVGRALGNLTEDAFQAEGPGWPQLRPATVKRRGSAHPILQASGGLAASITHGGDATSAWVGASKKYAAVQQFGQPKGASGRTRRGAPIPWGDIPPRPYLPMTPAGDLLPNAQTEVMAILVAALRALTGPSL